MYALKLLLILYTCFLSIERTYGFRVDGGETLYSKVLHGLPTLMLIVEWVLTFDRWLMLRDEDSILDCFIDTYINRLWSGLITLVHWMWQLEMGSDLFGFEEWENIKFQNHHYALKWLLIWLVEKTKVPRKMCLRKWSLTQLVEERTSNTNFMLWYGLIN